MNHAAQDVEQWELYSLRRDKHVIVDVPQKVRKEEQQKIAGVASKRYNSRSKLGKPQFGVKLAFIEHLQTCGDRIRKSPHPSNIKTLSL